jgi:hypothetical protein
MSVYTILTMQYTTALDRFFLLAMVVFTMQVL